jgi:excisionase family DNA binding protein
MDVLQQLAAANTCLTVSDLSAALKLHPQTIYGWVGKNRIPHIKLGSAVRFNPTDVVAWLKKRGA